MKKSYQTTSKSIANQIAGLSLRKNFSWTFIGNVIYAVCQWGMITVLAKLGSPEHVGQFALGLAVTAPVIMLTNLQLRAIQATDARNEYQFSDYLGLRLFTSVLAILIIAGITFFAGYRGEVALVILAFSLSKSIESISDIYYGLMQQHERMDFVAKSKIYRGILSLVALTTGFMLTGSVFWAVVSMAAVWGIVLVIYDMHSSLLLLRSCSSPIFPHWNGNTLIKLTWLSLPLGVVTMLVNLNISIPRYFIEYYLGEYELGVFAAMAYLIVVGTTVMQALEQPFAPRWAKYYAVSDEQSFRNLLLRLVGIGAMIGVGGVLVAMFAGREILTLIYGAEYARVDVFVWVMVSAGILNASSLGSAITSARYIKIQVPLFAFVAGSTAIACWLLIPDTGLLGGALALVIGSAVRAIGMAIIIKQVLAKLRTNKIKHPG